MDLPTTCPRFGASLSRFFSETELFAWGGEESGTSWFPFVTVSFRSPLVDDIFKNFRSGFQLESNTAVPKSLFQCSSGNLKCIPHVRLTYCVRWQVNMNKYGELRVKSCRGL